MKHDSISTCPVEEVKIYAHPTQGANPVELTPRTYMTMTCTVD